jgi:hypothetical protein
MKTIRRITALCLLAATVVAGGAAVAMAPDSTQDGQVVAGRGWRH